MPITQEPTLQAIDQQHNQFQIQFGVNMVPGEAPQDVTIPNLGTLLGADVYVVDFLKVNTPARGNFPAVRCIQFTLQTTATAAGADVGAVYLINPRTGQTLAILAPPPGAGVDVPSLVTGCLSFYTNSNQSLLLCRAASVNCEARLNATALTFDSSNFLTLMAPAP